MRGLFHKESLSEKIPLVILKLQGSLSRLDQINEALRKEDNDLFEKCIEARLKNDRVHSIMYANECAEIRKIALLMVSSKYALEQMVLRLNTVMKLDSLLVIMSPVVDVLKETKSKLTGIVPSVANNLGEANQILNKCLTNMGTSTISDVKPIACSEEALKILEEANIEAEKSIREKFPEIPQNLRVEGLKRTKLPAT